MSERIHGTPRPGAATVSFDHLRPEFHARRLDEWATLRETCAQWLPHATLAACVAKMQANKPDGGAVAGARLQLEGIAETVQRSFGIGPVEEVVMTRLDVTGHAHRDAVRFGNGKEVLLQSLNAGITAILMPEIDLTKYRSAESRELVDA